MTLENAQYTLLRAEMNGLASLYKVPKLLFFTLRFEIQSAVNSPHPHQPSPITVM